MGMVQTFKAALDKIFTYAGQTITNTIEAAHLAGFEPSSDNLTRAQLYTEANAYLQALNK